MIWTVSVENTAAFNTSTSHGVPTLNDINTLIMSCITLNWETFVILIGHVLSQQRLTDLLAVLETACSNTTSKNFRVVSSITIICLEDTLNNKNSIWGLYLLTKKPLISGSPDLSNFLVVWLIFNSRLEKR